MDRLISSEHLEKMTLITKFCRRNVITNIERSRVRRLGCQHHCKQANTCMFDRPTLALLNQLVALCSKYRRSFKYQSHIQNKKKYRKWYSAVNNMCLANIRIFFHVRAFHRSLFLATKHVYIKVILLISITLITSYVRSLCSSKKDVFIKDILFIS